jgi:integrase
MAISGFLKWCYDNKLRKTKLENIAHILNKKLRHQRTTRTLFSKDEYNQLLKVSRKRVKEGRTLRIRFDRERLHQFIIFMVGTGLRVDECLNLEWTDIEFMDRMKDRKNILSEIQLDENSRYWLRINVSQSKTNERQCKSVSSAYFALQRLMKLYKDTGLGKVKGQVFEVNSFREGLNSLLNEANLKTKKIGDAIVRRDSKSFRNTFIQFMLDKGVSAHAIAKNCGTSTAMIDKFYTANSAIESMLDVWLQTGRTKLKAVS